MIVNSVNCYLEIYFVTYRIKIIFEHNLGNFNQILSNNDIVVEIKTNYDVISGIKTNYDVTDQFKTIISS